MEHSKLRLIEDALGYVFNNKNLLKQAFTRKSFSEENSGTLDNEVLEFYGDSVLDFYLTRELFKNYGKTAGGYFVSAKNEDELTKMKSWYVKSKNLAHCIDILGFTEYLELGKSDIKNKVWENDSVCEDLFEAIVGAVAIDCDWDWNKINKVCYTMLKMCDFNFDFILELSLMCQDKKYNDPVYSVEPACDTKENTAESNNREITFEIPDRPHRYYKEFTGKGKYKATVYIKDLDMSFTGFGQSEYEAKMDCARNAGEQLDILEMKKAVGIPDPQNAVTQLNKLAQKKLISEEPEYNFEETHDNNGNPIWKCSCDFLDFDKIFEKENPSKREAKRLVAYEMLYKLMNAEGNAQEENHE